MVWLDVVRCIAMLMVIGVHCIDPFYISPTMRTIPEYTHWAAVYGLLLRPSVPLFVIFCYTQGHESQSLVDSLKDVAMIPFNFSHKENHMWYIYLLIRLYLYMPFFSGWIGSASKKTKQAFLFIWIISLFIPYIREYVSTMLFDRNGYIWGTDTWNEFNMLYYFAGFNWYLLLGHYLKQGVSWSTSKTMLISALMFAVGYYVTYCIFICSWIFTALVYKVMPNKARYIMG